MADQKLSELIELSTIPASGDEVYIRDVSEAAANESRRITVANLLGGVARTATLVVAANDSSDKSKAGADYVCGVTDDDVQIQAALDALPATGGKVMLLEGTFNVSLGITITKSGTILQGAGKGATKIDSTLATGDIIYVNGAQQTLVENMFITDINGSATRAVHVKDSSQSMLMNISTAYADNGIVLDDSELSLLVQVYSAHAANAAFKILSVSNVTILLNCVGILSERGMHFYGSQHGIQIIGGAIESNTVAGIEIETGTIRGFTIWGVFFDANAIDIELDSYDATHVIEMTAIINNYFPSGTTHNIDIGNYVKGVNIRDNYFGIVPSTGNIIITGGTGVSNILATENYFNVAPTLAANVIARHNVGYVTENSGASSIDSGQTTKVVAHGLGVTPTVINIAFREQGTSDFGRWWVDTIGATNFTLNVSADPGVSNLDFAWEAKVR